MPIISDATNSVTTNDAVLQVFGIPTPPPPPPTAVATLNSAPTVSSTPSPGQGVALDAAGRLNVATSFINVFTSDPVSPKIGSIWYRSDTSQICVRESATTTKRVTLS